MHAVIAETLDATVLIPEMIAKYFWQTEFTVQLGVYSLGDFKYCASFCLFNSRDEQEVSAFVGEI